MSKPRSKLIDYGARDFREVRGRTTAIHFGRQSKHIPGQTNYDSTKSRITISLGRLQDLLEIHAGLGERKSRDREAVDFGTQIGVFVDYLTGAESPTSRGIIHYGKAGAHVVPARPRSEGEV